MFLALLFVKQSLVFFIDGVTIKTIFLTFHKFINSAILSCICTRSSWRWRPLAPLQTSLPAKAPPTGRPGNWKKSKKAFSCRRRLFCFQRLLPGEKLSPWVTDEGVLHLLFCVHRLCATSSVSYADTFSSQGEGFLLSKASPSGEAVTNGD